MSKHRQPCLLTVTVPITPTSGTLARATLGGQIYTIPRLDDPDVPGLSAGLYKVTYSAPGYEPASIQVQVAQSALVPAPQVALQPLARIDGKVTTKVGTPTASSCVIALPSSGGTLPKTCTLKGDGTCTTANSQARCALTKGDGSYTIMGLTHGGYTVVVLPRDPEYLPTLPLLVQLGLAQDYDYEPVLDRLGRATVTVLAPNLTNLAVTSVVGAQVALLGAGATRRATTGTGGTAVLTGLPASTYTPIAAGSAGSRRGDPVSIGLNQTVAVSLVLTRQIGAAVGRLAVNVDGVATPVEAGTVVHVTGTVTFTGVSPTSGSATAVTDSAGCYAVLPAAGSVTATSGPCAGRTFTTGSTAMKLPLMAYPITVQAEPTAQTQASAAFPLLVGAAGPVHVIPTAVLNAQTSDTSKLSIAINGDGVTQHLSTGMVFQTVQKPAGSSGVTLTVPVGLTDNAQLSWQESSLTARNEAVPGSYQFTATKLGYASTTFWVYCGLGQPCVAVDDPAPGMRHPITPAVNQFPSVRNSPGGGIILPAGAPVPSKISIAVLRQPSTAGTVTVSPPDLTALHSGDAINITFADSGLSGAQATTAPGGLAWPGTYLFTVSVPGYQDTTVTVICGATFADPIGLGGCQPFQATLRAIPTFSGALGMTRSDGTGASAADLATASASITTGQSSVTVGIQTTGLATTPPVTAPLHWSDTTAALPGLVLPGSYTIRFTAPNYVPVDVTVAVRAVASKDLHCFVNDTDTGGVCDLSTVNLVQFPTGGGSVQTAKPVDWSKASVAITARPAGSGSLTITIPWTAGSTADQASLKWSDPTLSSTAAITQPGTYTISVSLPGYQTGSTTVECKPGVICAPSITLTPDPSFSGSLELIPHGAPTGDISLNVDPQTSGVPSATLSLGPVSSSTTKSDVYALTWTQNGLTGVVVPGNYQVSVSAPGRTGSSVLMTCTSDSNTTPASCTVPTLSLTSSSGLQLTILSSDGTVQAVGAQVTLSGSSISSSTLIAPATSNVVNFSGLAPGTTYQINVHAAGFATATGLGSSSTSVTCGADGGAASAGLQVIAGSTTTTCKVFLEQLATVTGFVQGSVPNQTTVNSISYANVSVQEITGGVPAGAIFKVRADNTGAFSISGTVTDEGLDPGDYQILADAPGYTSLTNGVITVAADRSISVKSGSGLAMVTSTTLPVTSLLSVTLTAKAVNLDIHTQISQKDVLVPVTVRLYGAGNLSVTCVITANASNTYSCQNGATGVTVKPTDPAPGTGYLEFAGIYPGAYTVEVTSPTSTYRSFSALVTIVPTDATTVPVPLSLDQLFSAQQFQVSMPQGAVPTDTTTLLLAPANDVTQVATDANGQPMSADAHGSSKTDVYTVDATKGLVTFLAVPDNSYYLVAEHDGYVSAVSPKITTSSTVPQQPTTIMLTTRAARPANIAVVSTAAPIPTLGTQPDLSSASLRLDPSPLKHYVGLADDSAFSNLQFSLVNGKWTAEVKGALLGTGTWAGSLTNQSNAPFPTTLTSNTITVPDLAVGETPAAASATMKLNQFLTKFTVSWGPNSCQDNSPPTAGDMSLKLTSSADTADTPTVDAPVTMNPDGSHTATGYAYLPVGQATYTVTPQVSGSGWQSPNATSFSSDDATTTANGLSLTVPLTLKATTVPVSVSMTLDGAPAKGFQVAGGNDNQTILNGTATLCVPPVAKTPVTVTLANDTDNTVQLAPQDVDASATNPRVTFTAVTIVPTISDTVANRPVDATDRSVKVSATLGSSTTLTSWQPTVVIAGNGTTVTVAPGSRPIIDKGASITVSATPDTTGDPFTKGQGTLDTATASGTGITVNLTYSRITVIVKVTDGGKAVKNANVTIDTVGPVTTDGNGVAIFLDTFLTAGSYVVKATDPATGHEGQSPSISLTAGTATDLRSTNPISLKAPAPPSSAAPSAPSSAAPSVPSSAAIPSH